jgi:hypothetical protein
VSATGGAGVGRGSVSDLRAELEAAGREGRLAEVLSDRDTETTLVDLLDRLLGAGIIIQGDVMLSVAGVDLLYVGLRLIVKVPGMPGDAG